MLVLVIILFAVCWGPLLLDNVLIAFGIVEKYNYGHLKYMRQAFSLMAYANSCVNPIVYAFMSRNFRDSFVHTLCSCIKGETYRRRHQFMRQISGTRDTQMTSMGYSMKSLKHTERNMIQTDLEVRGSPYRTRLIRADGMNSEDNDGSYSESECNL